MVVGLNRQRLLLLLFCLSEDRIMLAGVMYSSLKILSHKQRFMYVLLSARGAQLDCLTRSSGGTDQHFRSIFAAKCCTFSDFLCSLALPYFFNCSLILPLHLRLICGFKVYTRRMFGIKTVSRACRITTFVERSKVKKCL